MNIAHIILLIFTGVGSIHLGAADRKDIEASRNALLEVNETFNASIASNLQMSEIDAIYHDSLDRIKRLKDLPESERNDIRSHIEGSYKQVKKLHELLEQFHQGARHHELREVVKRMQERFEQVSKEIDKLDKVPAKRKEAAVDEMLRTLTLMHRALATHARNAQSAPQAEHKRSAAKNVAQPSGRHVREVAAAPRRAAAIVASPAERRIKPGEAAAARVEQQKEKRKSKVKGSKELYPGVESHS